MADIGKWLEGKAKGSFSEIQETHESMYYRFPDSRSAQNPMSAQPGDHLFLVGGKAILVEEKCSEKYASFRSGMSSLWSKKQAAQHRKWARAGGISWILFCHYQTGAVEIWNTSQRGGLALLRGQGKRLPAQVYPIGEGSISNLTSIIKTAALLSGVKL
jgi:hypothetical protein